MKQKLVYYEVESTQKRINEVEKKWVFVVPCHISWQRITIRCVVIVDYGHFSCRHIKEVMF